MISDTERSLGEALVSAKIMKQEDLAQAIDLVEKGLSPSLMIHLLKKEVLNFKIFQKFLSQNFKVKTAILSGKELPGQLLEKMGWPLMQEFFVLPMMEKTISGKKKVALAMVNPLDEAALLESQNKLGADITPVLISLSDFYEAVKNLAPAESAPAPAAIPAAVAKPKLSGTKEVSKRDLETLVNEIRKFPEEVVVRLGLDQFESEALAKDSYYPNDLISDLHKIKASTLERNFEGLSIDEKFVSLANALILKGVITKAELLESSGLVKVFGSKKL